VSATPAAETLLVFPSRLGWFGLFAAGEVVRRLTFGHRSARAAAQTIGCRPAPTSPTQVSGTLRVPVLRRHTDHASMVPGAGYYDARWQQSLVRRLQAYAEGVPMDFGDILLDIGRLTTFQRTVLQHCRGIPYGRTMTYGQLAGLAGAPRAARAVGNCMAANPVPLLVPCHRVLPASGGCGSYSAPGGARLKQQLLALEALGVARAGAPRG
jgi:O-6-methylguanine DNA methyltransferase